ncbi:MAG: carboxypeptidase regulatory-like domain-containing protein [Planctomycetes bacterium]|nr:carboxypeptidase regulatory-like domain-containing protein [Planctomycetota bacterium]
MTGADGRFELALPADVEGPLELSVLREALSGAEGVHDGPRRLARLRSADPAPEAATDDPRTVVRADLARAAAGVELALGLVRVSGRVARAEDDEPLAGARVLLADREVLTGPGGEFSIEAVALAHDPVVVMAPGRAPAAWTPLDQGAPQTAPTIRLARAATLAGRVLDARGAPLAGARIHCRHPLRDHRSRQTEFVFSVVSRWLEATTGPDGRFAFEGVPPAELELEVNAPGHLTLTTHRTGAGAPLELRLLAAHPVRGIVLGPAGPIAGATVCVLELAQPDDGTPRTIDLDPESRVFRAVECDEGGRFELTVPEGRGASLLVRAPRHGGQVVTPGAEDVVVRLEPAAALGGRVVGSDGRSLVVSARVAGSTSHWSTLAEATPGPGGEFRLEGLVRGAVVDVEVVDATLRTVLGGAAGVLVGDAPLEVAVTLPEAQARVRLRLVDASTRAPLDRQLQLDELVADDPDGDGRVRWVQDQGGGAWVVAGLPERAVRFIVHAPDLPPSVTRAVRVGPGVEVEVEAPLRAGGGLLEVRVDLPLRATIAQVEVRDPVEGVVHRLFPSAGDGGLAALALAPGAFEVRARTPGRGPSDAPWQTVVVREGETTRVALAVD